MKEFMEQYGGVVVALIVICVFVVAATPIGNALRNGVQEAINQLTAAMGNSTNRLPG